MKGNIIHARWKIRSRYKILGVHYIDAIMTTMASQITSLTVDYWTVYSDTDQRKHQSSASLAFEWRIHRDWWIPRTKVQLRGKCFHLMTSSWSRVDKAVTNEWKYEVDPNSYRYASIPSSKPALDPEFVRFNSLRPGDTHRLQWTGSLLVQTIACLLCSTKSLLVLVYCQLYPHEQTSVKF